MNELPIRNLLKYHILHAIKEREPKFKARRWIVEAAHSWMNRFRKLLIRFKK